MAIKGTASETPFFLPPIYAMFARTPHHAGNMH